MLFIVLPGIGNRLELAVLGSQSDVELAVPLSLGVASLWLEVNNEIVLDGEDGVGLEPGIISRENLRNNLFVSRSRDHEVNVGWAHWMAIQHLKQRP
jgi:hypothetical protein